MNEVWKRVSDWPEYEVSSLGRVRRVTGGTHLGRGDLLAQAEVRGYLHVTLFSDSRRRLMKVHRLVAQAFIQKPPGASQVAHNDGNPSNNAATNLRWDTGRGNLADRARHGTELIGARNGRTKLTAEQVAHIRANYKPRCPINSAAALARKFGVTDVAIIKAARGANWSHLNLDEPAPR